MAETGGAKLNRDGSLERQRPHRLRLLNKEKLCEDFFFLCW
jgi:hypothetical protein